jgi:hypothetical protein
LLAVAEAAERVLVIHQTKGHRRGVAVVVAVPGTTQAVVVVAVCREAVAVLVQAVEVVGVFPAPVAPVVVKERRVVLGVPWGAQIHVQAALAAEQVFTLSAIRL